MRAPTRSFGGVITLAAALALTGCSAIDDLVGNDEPERDDAGEIVEAAELDVFSLLVGDCVNSADLADTVETVPTVPCSEPHDSEAFAVMDLPAGDFPGNDAIDIAADDFCYDEFTAFVGIAWDDSTLDYFPLTPLEEGWNQLDDRQVLCFVFDGEGGVVGTLKDAAR
ncbi:septum formation family protein [Sanguibacter antarcticus]|uniref:Putative regulator of septum formation n=1 Tax=Sanguibacter antarcticus TaxID=372484 RepID=A0A2A9E9F8_9MICO|nr:septum formation family protein [Sanguibacter antarcticus]PFG34935.1 putative regulator of septum formation [Sanguibacter antarcticus]